MNPVVVVHLIATLIGIVASVPLIGRRVKMNRWYGIRIPAAFVSDERWFEINEYGGRLLLMWSVAIGATAIVGAFLKRKDWVAYDWAALVVVLGGLALVMALIHRHARKPDRV
jgi:hypothetical protein